MSRTKRLREEVRSLLEQKGEANTVEIFDHLKDKIKGLKIITDIHTEEQCRNIALVWPCASLVHPQFLLKNGDVI